MGVEKSYQVDIECPYCGLSHSLKVDGDNSHGVYTCKIPDPSRPNYGCKKKFWITHEIDRLIRVNLVSGKIEEESSKSSSVLLKDCGDFALHTTKAEDV